MNLLYIYIAIFIIIIILIIWLIINLKNRYHKYLAGVWIGHDDFMKESELSDMQLLILKQPSVGYLYMIDDSGDIVTNSPITIKHNINSHSAIKNLFSLHDICSFKVKITPINDTNLPFPSELSAKLSIIDGTLTLHDNKKIYAHMIKDINSTNLANSICSYH